jgi:hypothetical protein
MAHVQTKPYGNTLHSKQDKSNTTSVPNSREVYLWVHLPLPGTKQIKFKSQC